MGGSVALVLVICVLMGVSFGWDKKAEKNAAPSLNEEDVYEMNARRQIAVNMIAKRHGTGTGTADKDGVPGTPLSAQGYISHDRRTPEPVQSQAGKSHTYGMPNGGSGKWYGYTYGTGQMIGNPWMGHVTSYGGGSKDKGQGYVPVKMDQGTSLNGKGYGGMDKGKAYDSGSVWNYQMSTGTGDKYHAVPAMSPMGMTKD